MGKKTINNQNISIISDMVAPSLPVRQKHVVNHKYPVEVYKGNSRPWPRTVIRPVKEQNKLQFDVKRRVEQKIKERDIFYKNNPKNE